MTDTARRTFRQRTFGALVHPQFRRVWAGAVVSNAGTWLHAVAVGYIVASRTHDEFLVALVGFCSFFPSLVFGLLGGALADRFDRRKILLVGTWVDFGLTAVLALVFAVGWGSLAVIYLVTTGLGIAIAANGPSWFGYTPTLVPLADLPSAISLNAMQFNLGRVLGPAAGGFVLQHLGAAGAFGLNSLSFVALAVPLHMNRHFSPRTEGRRTEGSGLRQIADGLAYVWRHRPLRTMLTVALVQACFAAQLMTLLAAFAKNDLDLDAQGLGWLFAALGVGGFVGALASSNVVTVVRRERFVPAVLAGIGAGLILVSTQSSPVGVGLALVVAGTFYIGALSSLNALVQLYVDDSVRGRVSSLWFTVFVGVFPVAGLVWGAVARHTGTPFTYVVGGGACLVYAAFLWLRPGLLRDETSASEAGA